MGFEEKRREGERDSVLSNFELLGLRLRGVRKKEKNKVVLDALKHYVSFAARREEAVQFLEQAIEKIKEQDGMSRTVLESLKDIQDELSTFINEKFPE